VVLHFTRRLKLVVISSALNAKIQFLDAKDVLNSLMRSSELTSTSRLTETHDDVRRRDMQSMSWRRPVTDNHAIRMIVACFAVGLSVEVVTNIKTHEDTRSHQK
jgi:hypothetical protein